MTNPIKFKGATILAALIWLGPFAMPAALAQDEARSCQALVQTLAEDGRVALSGVTFDFNRASLRPDSLPALVAARDAILTLGGDWRIEGHTDDRGSHSYNQALSEARALAVRDWLVSAGLSSGQLSAQGFSFDRPVADNGTDAGRAQNRRVELVGQVTPDMLGFGGPDGVDPCPDTLTPGTLAAAEGAPRPPVITDWAGSGGQEFLPFSYLMATAQGGSAGWVGDRITMPPGTQPQTCQALCQAEGQCAAFSFEPAGSHFVEDARCVLIGYGTELTLKRDNTYLDGGIFAASGLKPDARLLTQESAAIATEILADLAEIAALRASVRIAAPESHAPETWMDIAIDGAVPGDAYPTYLEIAELGDYAFDWRNSKSHLFVHSMTDGRSGQIWSPEPGDYVLRYVINHPTAGQHSIVDYPLSVKAGAAAKAEMPSQTANADGAAIVVSGPRHVRAGEAIAVSWSAINDGSDWVTIVLAGAEEGTWTDYRYVGGNLADTLTAPDQPGLYEIRYVRNADYVTLGRYGVEVVAQGMSTAPPSPAQLPYETEGMGEDQAYYCPADAMPCQIEDAATGIGFTLMPGFFADWPYFYETAGGVAAAQPSLSLYRIADGAMVAAVNPRQMGADVGTCFEGLLGDVCLLHAEATEADAQIAFALLNGTLAPIEGKGEDAIAAMTVVTEPARDPAPAAVEDEDFTTAFMRQSGIGAMIEEAVKDDPEAAQMLELLGGFLGTGGGDGSGATPSRGAPPAAIAQLDGRIIDTGGMSAEDILAILLPRRGEGR